MARPTHDELARSFDAAARVYANGRPGYPAQALNWVLPPEADEVLDLGAGTGKLTLGLVDRGLAVTAVEPSDRMRAELEAELGDRVTALPGRAEEIPLPDASVDAVLVAQAWHWVDPTLAIPEVARVLRPGGRLGLLWNRRDERVAWVAALSEILSVPDPGARADAARPGIGPPFGAVKRCLTDGWTDTLTPQKLVDLAACRSYVITLDEDAREALLDRVRALTVEHPDLAGRERFELPYVTECVRADLPRAA
ncbi:MAG TPA: class I SAM-dependent methyltransferase [Solirubrobacteraceae bacterium]|nr:class I SAM-dependent methyltransferase [Solirubrobacteraceae bacterium]